MGKNYFTAGFDLTGYKAYYKYFTRSGMMEEEVDYTTDVALFAKYKYNYQDRLIIEPGIRLQYYASMSAAVPEPRLAMKYNLSRKVRLKLSAGLFSQNFTTITSDKM